jgi:hypothetical protein
VSRAGTIVLNINTDTPHLVSISQPQSVKNELCSFKGELLVAVSIAIDLGLPLFLVQTRLSSDSWDAASLLGPLPKQYEHHNRHHHYWHKVYITTCSVA